MRRLSLLLPFMFAASIHAAAPGILQHLPRNAQQCTAARARLVEQASRAWVNRIVHIEVPQNGGSAAWLRHVDQWLSWQQQIDHSLSLLLDRAGQLTEIENEAQRTAAIQAYLTICKSQIDLSGRVRYLSRDVVQSAADELEGDLDNFRRLISLAVKHRSSSAADALTYALFDPDSDDAEAFPAAIKHQVLELIGKSNRIVLLESVANYVSQKNQAADLIVHAVEVIRRLGLPQDPHPSHPKWVAKPPITAAKLQTILAKLPIPSRRAALLQRRKALVAWLVDRQRRGVRGREFRLGTIALREGDWFLMKNPSPYNEFTNVSPGLFTHVGIVTTTTSPQGVRRFVIVDLPERGSTIPAINVDAYLERTLHYAFFRHPNPLVARQLARAAASLIGKRSQFDLTFQTSRVEQVRGKLAQLKRVNTYCAGFLLLCAQETNAPGYHFFPVVERTAGGHCGANLKKLGISFGKNFVSPTGPLFSRTLQRVGMREPTYGPLRDIKDQIYSHFCRRMRDKPIRPAPTALQKLREQLAKLARNNPLLARALAKTSNVSEHMNLVAAAKTAAVIETLDEIARNSTDEFAAARNAIRDSDGDSLTELPVRFRSRHQRLFRRWRNDELTPRDLRVTLVEFYAKWGKDQIDKRFFP